MRVETAKKLGLTIPQSLPLRADQVIVRTVALWTMAAVALMTACAAATPRWVNVTDPSLGERDFDRDLYQCTRFVTLHPEYRSQRDIPVEGDRYEGIAETCLYERGWRKVKVPQ